MAEPETILVVGATGAQGGSVARHLLRRGKFRVRCLSRNPSSPKASALRAAGAEPVRGDLGDPVGLRDAVRGCRGVFGVTSFWEHFAGEYEHGRNLLDAVEAESTEHFVFSTLPSAKEISGGLLSVPHFDIKARLEEEARERSLPVTFVHVAFYYENFLTHFVPRRQPDGTWSFGFPQGDTPLAAVATEDIGGVVAAIFEDPGLHQGKVVGIVGDDSPAREYAAAMTRATERTVSYAHVARETFGAHAFPGAEELANMFEFNRIHIPSRSGDRTQSRRLYPEIQPFEGWIRKNAPKLVEAMDRAG